MRKVLLGTALLVVSIMFTVYFVRRGAFDNAALVLMVGLIVFVALAFTAVKEARKAKIGWYQWVNEKVEVRKERYPALPEEFRIDKKELKGETMLGTRPLTEEEMAALKGHFAPKIAWMEAIGGLWLTGIVGRFVFLRVNPVLGIVVMVCIGVCMIVFAFIETKERRQKYAADARDRHVQTIGTNEIDLYTNKEIPRVLEVLPHSKTIWSYQGYAFWRMPAVPAN